MTRHAVHALALDHEVGSIRPGKAADLAVWNVASPAKLSYWIGVALFERTYVAGKPHQAVGTAKLAESSNLLPGWVRSACETSRLRLQV